MVFKGRLRKPDEWLCYGKTKWLMSANDIRQLENLDRISAAEGGDLYLINGNMTKLADAGIFAAKADTKGKEEETNEEVLELKNKMVQNKDETSEKQERILFLSGTIAEESWFDDDVTRSFLRKNC